MDGLNLVGTRGDRIGGPRCPDGRLSHPGDPEGFRFLLRWGLGLYSTLALIVGPLGTQVPGAVGIVTVDSDPTCSGGWGDPPLKRHF